MKKKQNKILLISLLQLSLSINGFSQTLTAVDCNPAIGNSFRICQTTSITPGPSGTNMTWNFIDLFCSGGTVYADTMIMPGFQSATSLPGTNVLRCLGGIGGSTLALRVTSGGVEKLGEFSMNMSDTMKFSNPETITFFPMSYGSTFSDTYYRKSTYTVSSTATNTYILSATKNFTVDASGSLITPEANFPYALRVYSRAVEGTTLLPSNSQNTTTKDRYSWYAAGIKDPVLMLEILNVGTVNESQITYFLHNKNNMVGLKENGKLKEFISVYPNPASDKITIHGENLNKISIINGVGQSIKECLNITEKQTTLDVSDLSQGIYFIILSGKNGAMQQKKLVIEK